MSRTVIRAKNISVKQRLEESSFEIDEGFNLISGPSGSGKSTVALVLMGLLPTDTGFLTHVDKEGKEIFRVDSKSMHIGLVDKIVSSYQLESKANIAQKAYLSKYCGYVAQKPYLQGNISGRQYIEYYHGARGNKIDKTRLANILSVMSIDRLIDHPNNLLSGGEKQRVAIAFALAHQPQILIADEPTSSLDTANGDTVVEMVKSLSDTEGLNVIWISHDSKLLQYADNVIYAKDGKIHN